jgi:catechol 2,3-dioxygenase-like lactoylglutathione lyase family enzyme
MNAQIKSTVPVLASLDLQESVDFYTNQLGFKKVSQFDDYAIVSRDGAEIHFWLCDDRHIAGNTSCYIRAADTQALFREFPNCGLAIQEPVVRPWGMKELYVIDPTSLHTTSLPGTGPMKFAEGDHGAAVGRAGVGRN